ncbi:phage late control D family protein [Nodosilinea sp. FACHB-131]|uniref:phage late control D family protein n=1 Tax=Cyanophyceae TaxID=3028117 RepID=UPI001689C06A|nr:contractile injection system protein, VgrG/Pvc8 family [Nodosilinea sp. FACHB-131]MBD1873789.1 phage late control D family protein [Nodosilinea sp. FACHB-131]
MSFTSRAEIPIPTIKVQVQHSLRQFEAIADLQTVVVTDDIEAPSMFALTLASWDTEAGEFTWLDDELFTVGTAIDIQMGYGSDLKPLISGEITGLEPEFAPGSPPILTVRGHDLRHLLMHEQKTRSFTQMKLSDVAEKVIQEAGLSGKVTPTADKLDYILQHNQTDMEFLQSQARRIGYELAMVEKTLHFRPQQFAQDKDKDKVLTLSPKFDHLEFAPRMSAMGQVKQVEVRGWNPQETDRDKQPILGKAVANRDEIGKMGGTTSGPMAAFAGSSNPIVTQPVTTQAEADLLAKAHFNQRSLSYISGDGSCSGRADLRAGSLVDITDIGQRFSGLYYVVSAVHTYAPEQSYSTQFSVRRNAL